MSEKILGVLGGMGPLATVYFAKLVVEMTDADKDQNHISMIINNNTKIPDRTKFILDNSNENPVPILVNDAKKLQNSGCCAISIPCNTAHYFYEEIQKAVNIPVLNIVYETVKHIENNYEKNIKVGILATKGTVSSGIYQNYCNESSIEYILPNDELQDILMTVIYDKVKTGKNVSKNDFFSIIDNMKENGCDIVILGCTELSVIKNNLKIKRHDIVDSMEVLSKISIEFMGKNIVPNFFV